MKLQERSRPGSETSSRIVTAWFVVWDGGGVCVLSSVLTFLKSSVHLRVGEKLEGEVTWPWQTGQHFTPTLMQHGACSSPHTAQRERDITARQHMVHGDTEALWPTPGGTGLRET